jgi:hypothetical protein
MDVYATGGSEGNGGGLFGRLISSKVTDSYAYGNVYAATRYYSSPVKLTPAAGGIAGYAEDSRIVNSVYFGGRLESE